MNARNETIDYDALYRNRPAVPDHPRILRAWEEGSDQARATLRCQLDIPYGDSEAERLDLYLPEGPCVGTFMFIHGGYWQGMDKREHGFIALQLASRGIAVVVPNYGLCPTVTMQEIVRQVHGATQWVLREGASFGMDTSRFVVGGHSAGGHLTAMLMTTDWRMIDPALPKQVFDCGIAISGLYDLREITLVESVNRNTRLDLAQAKALSPIFMKPATSAPLHLVVGQSELERFQAQQADFAREWGSVTTETRLAGENHYSILLQFSRPGSQLVQLATSPFALTPPGKPLHASS